MKINNFFFNLRLLSSVLDLNLVTSLYSQDSHRHSISYFAIQLVVTPARN